MERVSGAATEPRSRLARLADACGLLVAAIGLLVVGGWLLNFEPLKRVHPDAVAMKVNTAVGLLAAGLALWLRQRGALRLALGAFVAVLGALTLIEYLAGADLGIDQLLLRDVLAHPEAPYPPGRMAPSTAGCFLLLGLALTGIGHGRRRPGLRSPGELKSLALELAALTATVIAGFSVIAYPTGAVVLRQLPGSVGMALHAAIAFVVLGVGVLLAAEGVVARSLRLRATDRALWIGFGVLTGLLATVGIVFSINLQVLAADIDAQANVARPRLEAVVGLENGIRGYGLAVPEAIDGSARARRQVAEDILDVEGHLAAYRTLATSDRQRELATRVAGQWGDFRALGAALLEVGLPRPEALARLVAVRVELERLLEEHLHPDALEAFENRRTITLRDLKLTGEWPLLLLVVSVVLALLTSGAVARVVLGKEEALSEQREWLRVTLSSIGDGVIACDVERRVTFLNPVASTLSGWTVDEALGQPIASVLRLINEETRAPAEDVIEEVLRHGRTVELANHTALLTRDGREVPIEDSAAPMTDALGKVTGVVLVFHDVTQRRRATGLLKESETRLCRAQAIAHLGSWELDLVTNHLTWSDEVYRIFGLEPGFAASYQAFLEAVHPDDRASVDAAYTQSVREGLDAYESEHRIVRRSTGEVRTVHQKCQHWRDASGRIVRSIGMVHDVTERKRASDALRLSEARLRLLSGTAGRLLAEANPQALIDELCSRVMEHLGCEVFFNFLVDEAGSRLRLNACAGIPVEEAKKLEVLDFGVAVCGCAALERKRIIAEHILEGSDHRTALVKSLGVQAYCCHPLIVQGRLLGTLSFGTRTRPRFTSEEVDTMQTVADQVAIAMERMQSQLALRLANQQLLEADRRKNEFLAVLSHELRNPLAPIRNSLYVLGRATPGSEQAMHAQAVIDRQAGHLARLVDDLLDVTRISQNKIRLEREPLDLNEIVSSTVEDHRSHFEKHGVALELRLERQRIDVNADRTRLAQVLGNLLQNAAKFTSRGGHATLCTSLEPETRRAVVRLADDGVGIAPELRGRLFQPFMQADASLDRSKGGLGLGLALVKGLVELHGGEVRVRSEGPMKGAEFTVSLPLAPAAVDAPEAAHPSAPRPGRRVLIIEDNVDAADSLRDVLEFGAHEVAVAYSGSEGLAKAREFRPEVVLCDIGLPGMDGFEVARSFRADDSFRETLLVALTGYALQEDLQRASDAGFGGHLAKPPNIEKLQELLAAR
jgi:PAS domain S-box-containing protein